MSAHQHRATFILIAVVICGLVALGLRYRSFHDRSRSIPPDETSAFDEAQNQAFAIIKQRAQWPQSPEVLCRAFWDARVARNYAEMAVLWPGSASWNWPEICKNDPNVAYVFGQASGDGRAVPYASQDYFDVHGTYNLTMHLRILQTDKGLRYYIVSGN